MSRETDSSPYPQDGGRGGGASYPSGTPAYGTGTPAGRPQDGASRDTSGGQQQPEETKTETTITTRVRINIPGSRPIPPVVLRTQAPGSDDGEGGGRPDGGPGAVREPGADRPTGPPPGREFPGAGSTTAQDGPPAASGALPGPGDPGESRGSGASGTSDWFAPRRGVQQQPSADPEATAQHPLPQRTPGLSQAPAPSGPHTPGQIPAARSGADRQNPFAAGLALSGELDATAARGQGGQDRGDWPGGRPDPVQGHGGGYPGEVQGPVPPYPQQQFPPPAAGGRGGEPEGFPGYRPPVGTPTGPGSGEPARPVPPAEVPPSYAQQPPGRQPQVPRPGAGGDGGPPRGPGGGYRPGGADLSSDTLVSGIPAVQPHVPAAPRGTGAPPGDEYRFDDEDAPRGRSKLILAVVALLGVVGAGYGAGLLLDHADVPKGTTVLGVDIGGRSKPEAVKALDARLARRAAQPVPVLIGGKKAELDPRVAGLGIDTTVTVRKVAHRDYNPVSVIGSLLGGEREADAEFVIDEEKLRAALEGLAQEAGAQGKDGMVKFVAGRPVGVPGEPSLGLDVERSVDVVREAFSARAGTGANPAVELSRTQQEPKVTQEEIDRAVKDFGVPAMSGWVYLRAGDVEVPFSQNTISQFLTMRSGGDGKLHPVIDEKVLAEKYGGAFDGVKVDRATGTVAMTPLDAEVAMIQALRVPAPRPPAKRVAQVEKSHR